MLLYIILAVLIFGFLIAIHELGHFVAAKSLGVQVNEFSIGMGPLLLHRQGKETLYSLRLLPVGGFCAMEGEDEQSDNPRAFARQPGWKKLIILAAGCAMNFLAGIVLLLILFMGAAGFSTTTITGFMDGFPLEGENMLLEGDQILKINGERVYVYRDVSMLLSMGDGERVDLVIRRGGETIKLDGLPLTLREYEVNGQTVSRYGLYFGTERANLAVCLKYSLFNAMDFARMVRLSLAQLLSGGVEVSQMSGVIGVVDAVSAVGAQSAGWRELVNNMLWFSAFIAVNLAVMNMLPIPALDGGRVFFLIINGLVYLLTRRELDPKYEGYVHTAGFALLMGLMVVLAVNDVMRIILR